MTAAHLLFNSSGIVVLGLAIFSSFESCAAVGAALLSALCLYSQFSAVGATLTAAFASNGDDHFVSALCAFAVFADGLEKCKLLAVRTKLSGQGPHLPNDFDEN